MAQSLNSVDLLFKAISDAHSVIQGRYTLGSDLDLSSTELKYPRIHIVPQSSQVRLNVVTHTLFVMCIDIAEQDNNTMLKEVWSDTQQVLIDYVKFIRSYDGNPAWFDLVGEPTMVPILEDYRDRFTGHGMTITIQVDLNVGDCDVPVFDPIICGTSEYPFIVNPIGPTGSQGVVGPQGPTGPQGFQGYQGFTGPTWDFDCEQLLDAALVTFFDPFEGATEVFTYLNPTEYRSLNNPANRFIFSAGNWFLNGIPGIGFDTTHPWTLQYNNASSVFQATICDALYYSARAGAQGRQGRQGFQGRQGNQGFQGTGVQGLQGNQGFQGIGGDGAVGPQGNQGFQGIKGTDAVGLQGFQGPQGELGKVGFQGNQGVQGLRGDSITGNTGLQGFQGRQGNQGLQGRQGNQGFQGFQGQGFQGNQGFGFQGLQGPSSGVGGTGNQGPNGNQGPEGLQGPQGFQGIGTDGVQGPFGFQGFQGPGSGGATASGEQTVIISVADWSDYLFVGTGQHYFRVPDVLTGLELSDAQAQVASTSSVTGDTKIDLYLGNQTVGTSPLSWSNMLSTVIHIENSIIDSRFSATPSVAVSPLPLTTGDLIRVDIISITDDVRGLSVNLKFIP